MKRWQWSIRFMLLAFVVLGISFAIYKHFNRLPAYSISTFELDYYTAYGNVFGTEYYAEVTSEDMRGTPSWDRRDMNPPLPAGEAIIRADQIRIEMIENGELPSVAPETWVLAKVKLVPFDNERGAWFWLVYYFIDMEQTGSPNEIEFPVLMDGTVLRPKEREEAQ